MWQSHHWKQNYPDVIALRSNLIYSTLAQRLPPYTVSINVRSTLLKVNSPTNNTTTIKTPL
jgi:hypothetical protein